LRSRFAAWLKKVGVSARINSVIFSDLGQASSFMALDWVQAALKKILGFAPFPATLNVRPKMDEDARIWEAVQKNLPGIPLPAAAGGFCSARLYRVAIRGTVNSEEGSMMNGAVLLPEVADYPKDKIEIVAPVQLKSALGLKDGDQLTLEFVN
jgi:CTP-dependent riboflavin kinase